MVLRIKNFNILGSLKNPTFRGQFTKNQYRKWGFPKKGGLGQFVNLRGGLAKKREWCFCGVGVIPQCTLFTICQQSWSLSGSLVDFKNWPATWRLHLNCMAYMQMLTKPKTWSQSRTSLYTFCLMVESIPRIVTYPHQPWNLNKSLRQCLQHACKKSAFLG